MIDISGWQHPTNEPIDWPEVYKSGVRAVMVKCSEGIDYVNPWLESDVMGAFDAHLKVGTYHFSHPGLSTVEEQARYALAASAPYDKQITLGIADDLEVQEGKTWDELGGWAKGFNAYVAPHTVYSPLYINGYFLELMVGAPWGLRLWLASWGSRPRREVWAYQSSATGSVPGIVGDVDLDVLS